MNNSPFKFLDAYEKQDKEFFFGREKETEELYEMTYNTRLILLYGASGTGKTSLIQCGLANQFQASRWLDLFVRKGDHIMESLEWAVEQELEKLTGKTPEGKTSLIDGLDQLHRITFKPLYLILDQFEELFILGDKQEQKEFFLFLKELLSSKLSCKVILSMREEYIAYLWDYESLVPSLFDYRYRIEKIRPEGGAALVFRILKTLDEKGVLSVEEPEKLASGILKRLNMEERGIELTYLQVYLDRLYRAGVEAEGENVVLRCEMLDGLGEIDDVIGDFLDEQLHELELELGKGHEDVPIRILSQMVTDEKTKKTLSLENKDLLLYKLNIHESHFNRCIEAFEKMRIVKAVGR
jgi:hypothetical protein